MPAPKLSESGAIIYGAHGTFLAGWASEFSGRIRFIRLHCMEDGTDHEVPDEEKAQELAKTYVPVPKHERN